MTDTVNAKPEVKVELKMGIKFTSEIRQNPKPVTEEQKTKK